MRHDLVAEIDALFASGAISVVSTAELEAIESGGDNVVAKRSPNFVAIHFVRNGKRVERAKLAA